MNSAVNYWSNQPTDQPWLLNGFTGTFSFSDYDLIPDAIIPFLHEYFYKKLPETRKGHIRAIPLEEINALMNEVWEGPGSMVKVAQMAQDMQKSRINDTIYDGKDVFKGYDTPTVDSNLGENVVDRLEK